MPDVNLNCKGSMLTPVVVRYLLASLTLAYGEIGKDEGYWAEMHPRVAYEWEANGFPVQHIQIDGNELPSPWIPERTFAGLPLEPNVWMDKTVVIIRKNRQIVGSIIEIGILEEVNA